MYTFLILSFNFPHYTLCSCFYFYLLIFLFVAFCTPPAGDLACNPGMCPDRESTWQLFSLQASAHQPGSVVVFNLISCQYRLVFSQPLIRFCRNILLSHVMTLYKFQCQYATFSPSLPICRKFGISPFRIAQSEP